MRTEISLHGRPIASVFELLGTRENDVTYSIGWALAQSPTLRRALLTRAFGAEGLEARAVMLQERVRGGGITDIELVGDEVHLVIEAKRGWQTPTREQLELYLPRLRQSNRQHRAFMTMSECTAEAAAHLLPSEVGGVPVTQLAWHEVQAMARARTRSRAERHLLRELVTYLERVVRMQNKESNWVMTVVLNDDRPAGYGLSFKEIVLQRGMYFHPVGSGYSQVPENYMGFRWGGYLQSIHHVEAFKVVWDISAEIPELRPGPWTVPHYLYRLGPAIVPPRPVANGRIHAAARIRAMIDLLLTCETVAEARRKSKERVALVSE